MGKRSQKQPIAPLNEAVDEVVELCLRILSQQRHELAFAELCRLLSPDQGLPAWQSTLDPKMAALLKASPAWASALACLHNGQILDRRALAKSLATSLLDLRRQFYFEAIELARAGGDDAEEVT